MRWRKNRKAAAKCTLGYLSHAHTTIHKHAGACAQSCARRHHTQWGWLLRLCTWIQYCLLSVWRTAANSQQTSQYTSTGKGIWVAGFYTVFNTVPQRLQALKITRSILILNSKTSRTAIWKLSQSLCFYSKNSIWSLLAVFLGIIKFF